VLDTGVCRVVYMCSLARNFQAVARTGAKPDYELPSLHESIEWWRRRWLAMRVRNRDVMTRVREFRGEKKYGAEVLCGFE
jgi:hypothetical protein